MRRLDEQSTLAVGAVIEAHRETLMGLAGVLGAEPGFPVVDSKLVREPAIILYVRRKAPLDHLLPEDVAPEQLDGVRVHVVQVDPWKQLELEAGHEAFTAALDGAALAGLTYEPIPGDPIDATFTVEKPFLCHAGPDAGWPVLKTFLERGQDTLTVAMYDFSATWVSTKLIAEARARDWTIALTIDDARKPDELAIQDQIKDKLGPRYDASVIICGGDRRFPSAYHPKVAVQDNKRFWISSGNWSPASQPDIDPVANPAQVAGMYSKGNREWHLVVEDAPLAKLFERYILHDKAAADSDTSLGGGEATAFPDLFVPLDELMAEGAALAGAGPVAPRLLPDPPKPVKVRPLLSPDNYAGRITEWIKGAQDRLYLQYSYITYSKRDVDKDFRALLDHLGELSWKPNFDLRIIVGPDKEKVRVLAQNGFNEAKVKTQGRIHNKGIVRDGEQALVSSQNWSGDGFLRNRDAGLIIADPQVAKYYEDIFLEDWTTRARLPFEDGGLSAVIAPPGAPTPPGMARLSWSDVFGD